jgi:hypothetical protein
MRVVLRATTRWVAVSSFTTDVTFVKRIADVSIDGFFDAGMLQAALKAKEEGERPAEKVAARREVGKKLRLMEY